MFDEFTVLKTSNLVPKYYTCLCIPERLPANRLVLFSLKTYIGGVTITSQKWRRHTRALSPPLTRIAKMLEKNRKRRYEMNRFINWFWLKNDLYSKYCAEKKKKVKTVKGWKSWCMSVGWTAWFIIIHVRSNCTVSGVSVVQCKCRECSDRYTKSYLLSLFET